MVHTEQTFVFDYQQQQLVGIVHSATSGSADLGVLIVVGGPQYRIGSHRQFVLMARQLAANGIPCMRFDNCGMGDASGERADCLHNQGEIAQALAQFKQHTGVQRFVLLGLCDGASAALHYAPQDETVVGLVLINPWFHSEQGEAKAYLKHYYRDRLLSKDLWRKILGGRFQLKQSVLDATRLLRKALQRNSNPSTNTQAETQAHTLSLPEQLTQDAVRYQGQLLVVLSEADYVAREFEDFIARHPQWKAIRQQARYQCVPLPDALHTFPQQTQRDALMQQVQQWLQHCFN